MTYSGCSLHYITNRSRQISLRLPAQLGVKLITAKGNKTILHIAAACGNVVTIEGVTCISDDIDYGDYKIVKGKIQVSDKPGFGMKILI